MGRIWEIDIRDLISLDDAVDEMKLGPNGGLVFCVEYLSQNMEWLEDELSQFDEDGYFIFDSPGINFCIVLDRQDKSNCLLTLASLVILQSTLLTSVFT